MVRYASFRLALAVPTLIGVLLKRVGVSRDNTRRVDSIDVRR